ncbi:DUF501 domain-containing protein [Saccharomonospora azurea]|uniref:Septum formation initiator family protein n=1 Tax=Saccharomonospora azurea NA-128 TaxID=882081 RepID=H8GDW4_9PSEU|nr:DUF501 domain-containing protein [Saccharomonospora azurea]EHY88908.1 hypothetical protein SacazDRAFT_01991 [Saccharomonospora azurea NA-128]
MEQRDGEVSPIEFEPVTEADREVIRQQLGRPPRALRAVAARCPSGHPSVVQTNPRLEDGTPFPTLYYLTCATLTSMVGRLEASGIMREMTDRLAEDADLAEAYRQAHESYLAQRDAIEPLGHQVTAGGMPTRVKCLHVHLAHTLACGIGVNPFGDETLRLLREDGWPLGDCAQPR